MDILLKIIKEFDYLNILYLILGIIKGFFLKKNIFYLIGWDTLLSLVIIIVYVCIILIVSNNNERVWPFTIFSQYQGALRLTIPLFIIKFLNRLFWLHNKII